MGKKKNKKPKKISTPAVHVKPEPSGPREFRPAKGEESESRTWFTPAGNPIKGMPSAREPIQRLSDQGRKNYDDALGEHQINNSQPDKKTYRIDSNGKRTVLRKCKGCPHQDDTYDSGCSIWGDQERCKGQKKKKTIPMYSAKYRPPLRGEGSYDG